MYNTYVQPVIDRPMNLQLFADAGSLVVATGNYVNAGTGTTTAFDTNNSMSTEMKTYYDTEMLENSRSQLIYAQLGRTQNLPANHGKTVEWRKWNTLPDCDKLTEGVIPTGKKFGATSITVEVEQYGQYVALTDQVETYTIDNTLVGATEELGAAGGKTYDKLVRNETAKSTNKLFADAYDGDTYKSTPTSRAELIAAAKADASSSKAAYQCYLTPDMIAKAATILRAANAPKYDGRWYVAVVNPYVTYDLRKNKDWNEYHKYADTTPIFEGEIGELHGVRFVESDLAPVIKSGSDPAVFLTMIFGKDAFGVVKPEGMGMESIYKSRKEIGGPLEQFCTMGTKFSMAAKILYPERMIVLETTSSYSNVAAAN